MPVTWSLLKPGLMGPECVGLRQRGGGFVRVAATSSGITYPATAAQLGTWAGVSTPTGMWRGDESSGATDLVASADLSDVGTPTHDVASGADALNATVITFTDDSTDALVASANTVLDGANSSHMMLWLGIVNTAANSRQLIGKYASGGPGYMLWINGTSIRANFHDGTSVDAEVLSQTPTTGLPLLIVALRDDNANNVQIFSSLGNSTGQVVNSASTANTDTLRIGDNVPIAFEAAGCDFSMAALWIGAGCEGFNATKFSALEASLNMP